MKKKKENWLRTLLGYAGGYRKKFGQSIVLSVISVTAGLLPFFCMYEIICRFVDETVTANTILIWCGLALLSYCIRILCYAGSTAASHQVAYHVLESLRLKLADRFLHAPLEEVQSHSIGEIKNIMIDKIEGIEPPLAHVVPESAGHIVLPVISIVSLAVIDWRIALASLVTFPAAFVCMALTFWISGKKFRHV